MNDEWLGNKKLDRKTANFWNRAIRLIGGMIIRWIYRIRVVNAGRLPADGGALLLPNHVTFADAFFISAVCPRPVRFVMDEVFMTKRSIRWFVSIFNTVTIRRDQPREAIRVTIDALKNGDLVCLFPEGQLTRTGVLSELQRGCELIAKKAKHPVIPMWCDGSWASIFSFERGKVFAKLPYWKISGVTVAFGREISPQQVSLKAVQQEMLVCSADAITDRFRPSGWSKRMLKRGLCGASDFCSDENNRRKQMWINGYQIGQINALQRQQSFSIIENDSIPLGFLTFSELFGAPITILTSSDIAQSRIWVGGDGLRNLLETTDLRHEVTFYDFSQRALTPLIRSGLYHFPCLAVDGMVIAMSMPNPPKPDVGSEYQSGNKPRSWGKLLSGWSILPAGNDSSRIYGPAAPEEGLILPVGCLLDGEGFLIGS